MHKYGEIGMRSVERIKQSELGAIIFQKTLIKILELDFQIVFITLLLFFVLDLPL